MPVEYRTGNLFSTEAPAIAQGCNCQGLMGAGIAVQFQRRYPEMYQEYRTRCKTGLFNPGDVWAWKEEGVPGAKLILNLGTQDYPGPHARTEWLEEALKKALALPGLTSVALPRIGCGLGGLEWEKVQEVIERLGKSSSVTLIVYTL